MESPRPDSRRRALMESARPSSMHHAPGNAPRWNFITSSALSLSTTPRSNGSSSSLTDRPSNEWARLLSATSSSGLEGETPFLFTPAHIPAPPSLLTTPLVKAPYNPQAMCATRAYNQHLPPRIQRPLSHGLLIENDDWFQQHNSNDDPDVELPSKPRPPPSSATAAAGRDPVPFHAKNMSFAREVIARLDQQRPGPVALLSHPLSSSQGVEADAQLRGMLQVMTQAPSSNTSSPRSRFAVSPSDPMRATSVTSQEGVPALRRVHFDDEMPKNTRAVEKQAAVKQKSGAVRIQQRVLSPPTAAAKRHGTGTPSAGSSSATPDDARRRSSRAMYIERLSMVKAALGKVISEVSEEFDFASDVAQHRQLHEVVALLDDAMLGQEYTLAHPSLPASSEFFADDGAGFAKVFGAKQRPRPLPVTMNIHSLSRSPPRSPLLATPSNSTTTSLPLISENRPPLISSPTSVISGRRNSAYCIAVAEARRKTGIAAGSSQLCAAAEEMERANAEHLQSLMPLHDDAMNQLKVLGLL